MEIMATYSVSGMTCGHCANSVRAELETIPGVLAAMVDLRSGRVRVTSTSAIDPDVVRSAVDRAGYEVVS